MRRLGSLGALAACAALLALGACKANDGAGNARTSGNGAANTGSTTASSTTAPGGNTTTASGSVTVGPNGQTLPAEPGDGVRRVSIADARRAVESGEAVFIDVRSKAEYDRGHIKGALSFPKSEVQTRFGELPKNKLIIAYCA